MNMSRALHSQQLDDYSGGTSTSASTGTSTGLQCPAQCQCIKTQTHSSYASIYSTSLLLGVSYDFLSGIMVGIAFTLLVLGMNKKSDRLWMRRMTGSASSSSSSSSVEKIETKKQTSISQENGKVEVVKKEEVVSLFHPESKSESESESKYQSSGCGSKCDYGYKVLEGAIQLFAQKNKPHMRHPSSNNVVNYLSAEEMLSNLFSQDDDEDGSNSPSLTLNHTTMRNDDDDNNNNNNNKNNNTDHKSLKQLQLDKVQQMMKCFQMIQTYSVNTNHPYFFNQLFGAVDPVALAAEVIALSVNTSAYTWETAPVFTLIEREVLAHVHRLVFHRDAGGLLKDSNKSWGKTKDDVSHKNTGAGIEGWDGLMLPGGSLSNLTALHVARHYAKYGTHPKPITTNYLTSCTSACTPQQTASCQNNSTTTSSSSSWQGNDHEEEKKEQDELYPTHSNNHSSTIVIDPSLSSAPSSMANDNFETDLEVESESDLVAFVSSEAHYSFTKAVSVTGIGTENLIVIPTLPNGQMDVQQLDRLMMDLISEKHENYGSCASASRSRRRSRMRIPFFVAVTSGSTVRGSFDDIEAIVEVCRKHEERMNTDANFIKKTKTNKHKIWVHVDGAWGGSAIFSSRHDIRSLMNGVENVDSFTFNPHKLIGAPQQTTVFVTRHEGILKAANSSGAKYLFDSRKNGAEYDLGDASYTCGRRTDAIKLWALWKFHGPHGIGKSLEEKVDSLQYFVKRVKERRNFMLACDPWPFNVNFFYIPERIRQRLLDIGVDTTNNSNEHDDVLPEIPHDISEELAKVSVELKLRLHQSGEMLIPYQPLSNQKADCFRIVLAGYKPFDDSDVEKVLDLMERYGKDL